MTPRRRHPCRLFPGFLLMFSVSHCVPTAYALTLAEIQTQVRLIVDPSTVTGKQIFTDAQLQTWINQAHIDVIRRSKCMQATAYVDTSSTTRYVHIPPDAMTIDRVAYWDGASTSTLSYRFLARTFKSSLDSKSPSWERPTYGIPQEWFVFGSSIGLHPIPSAAYAGSARMAIDYTVRVSSLTNASDVPFGDNPTLYPYHLTLVWYTVWMAYQSIGSLSYADYYRKMYYDSISIMITELRDYAGWQPTIRVQ